jgi:pyruvate ferredoxin oxidoreductase beta subunit
MGRLATETGFWTLYEIINSKFVLSQPNKKFLDPSKRKPIEQYLSAQKRFNNISKQEIETYNHYIEDQWNEIKRRLENQ